MTATVTRDDAALATSVPALATVGDYALLGRPRPSRNRDWQVVLGLRRSRCDLAVLLAAEPAALERLVADLDGENNEQ